MKAIVIAQDKFEELLQRLLVELAAYKLQLDSHEDRNASYHRHAHYLVHKFARCVAGEETWTPNYSPRDLAIGRIDDALKEAAKKILEETE